MKPVVTNEDANPIVKPKPPQIVMAADGHVMLEVRGCAGLITLNRPAALNALSLPMIRAITVILQQWRAQPAIKLVAIRGNSKLGAFGAFCAGGDIRFFHQAALAGDPALEDFFTEEYTLNHLIHTYPKPYVAFMDGIVMGGGMGISQGASHRIVTERTQMAMPETGIGLFPDVGGGYFLSACPGHVGEYLALTGQVIGAEDALDAGLADAALDASMLDDLWNQLPHMSVVTEAAITKLIDKTSAIKNIAACALEQRTLAQNLIKIDKLFACNSLLEIITSLDADDSAWAKKTAATMRKRSPLMLHVVLEQIRRARALSLAGDLRMERDMVRHCFYTRHLQRSGTATETAEGIRALAVDKDHTPRWNPARLEDVTVEMVAPFFVSPWPSHSHPLRGLAE